MAKYNLYKIKESRTEELVAHLRDDRNYRLTSTQTSDGYVMRTYFSGPDDADMWWLEQYGEDFFADNVARRNQIYSGAVIANKGLRGYILPFGKTHFYIQEYIEYNFGLEMAEKIANKNQAKMKSLKRFGAKISKSLVSFNTGSSLDFSSGDSAEYVKLKAANADDWGRSFIHFGSSVQFGNIDIEPSDLSVLLNRVDTAWGGAKSFSIPLMRAIKDDAKTISLYRELGGKILDNDADVSFVDYEIYGTDFVFSQQTTVRLKYNGAVSDILHDLSTADIAVFARTHEIDLQNELPKLKVQIIVDGQSKYTTNILNIIEYHSGRDIFLYKGKWFVFNESFVEQLHHSLQNMLPARFPDSFSEEEFSVWQAARAAGIKYRERFVIEKIHETHGYEIYDRVMDYIPYGTNKYRIEVGDIYDRDNKRMYVVKIGEPKDFGYAFDQAMVVLHNMQGNQYQESVGQLVEIDIMTVLLLFQSERTMSNVTDINSIIFLLKLDELRKLALEKDVNLEIQYSTIV